MEKRYRPHEFAELLGVTVRTIQRWDTDGKLKAYRTPTDRRFYTHEQYLMCVGESVKPEIKGKSVIYARVSNQGQKDDLINQVKFLRDFVNARGIIVDDVIEEIGSGLNYKRKNRKYKKRSRMTRNVKSLQDRNQAERRTSAAD